MKPAAQRWLALALTAFGAAFLVKGYLGIFLLSEPSDMGHRTAGLTFIRSGVTPYGPVHIVAPDAPWAWLGNAAIYWPPDPWLRGYYSILMLGVVALLWWWGWAVGCAVDRQRAFLLAASTLAISSVCTSLALGQNSPFVIAALVGCLLSAERGHRISAGLCLGFAMAKPQVAAPFALPFLWQGEFLVLASAAVYIAVATLIVCWLVSLSPWALMQSWLAYLGDSPRWPGYGPLQWLADLGVPEGTAIVLVALIFGGAAAVAIGMLRRRPLLLLFAVAAVGGRLWSYHQLYDNVMLVFLLLAVGEWAGRRRDVLTGALFIAVGLTIWAPGRFCDIPLFQTYQMLAWVGGAALLVLMDRPPATGRARSLAASA